MLTHKGLLSAHAQDRVRRYGKFKPGWYFTGDLSGIRIKGARSAARMEVDGFVDYYLKKLFAGVLPDVDAISTATGAAPNWVDYYSILNTSGIHTGVGKYSAEEHAPGLIDYYLKNLEVGSMANITGSFTGVSVGNLFPFYPSPITIPNGNILLDSTID